MTAMRTPWILALLTACSGSPTEWNSLQDEIRTRFPEAEQLSIEDFEELRKPSTLVVDVRALEEYEVSHLPGAVHATSAEDILTLAEAEQAADIVVYCSVGWRSSDMVTRLTGKTDLPLYNLEGSIFAWANSGREVVRGETVVPKVHPYDEEWGRLLRSEARAALPIER